MYAVFHTAVLGVVEIHVLLSSTECCIIRDAINANNSENYEREGFSIQNLHLCFTLGKRADRQDESK